MVQDRCTVYTMQLYSSAVLAIIVCLTVWLSITCWYCIKTAKHRIMQTMPHNRPGILVFWWQRSSWNSNGDTPTGAQNAGWMG